MTFIDFCSGIGGGRLGLELNGFKCLGFSEIDKDAIKTYERFFDTQYELNLGDLSLIDPFLLPDFDLLISGFPCQSFSIVGKRKGLEDFKNGKIIYHLADILKVKKPSFFILENVKGLLNHNKRQTFREILNLLNTCGYNVYDKVLNTIDFALAQSRERIYFIGIRNDKKIDFNFSNLEYKRAKIKDFLTPNDKNILSKDSQKYQTLLRYLQNKYNASKFNLNELLKRDYLILDTRQSDLRLYEDKIPTLRRDRQGILYVFNNELFSLSGIEALKLQGFGKINNLEKRIIGLKEKSLLAQCGNAMSVNVIEFLGKLIKDSING